MQFYDRAYKRLFAHPEMVAHLLWLIPEKWIEALRWTTLQRVNTVLVASPPLERQADMIWRVRPKGGRVDLYLVLEFRTWPDRSIPVRMLAYVALLYQELLRENMLRGKRYPPIVCSIVYTGLQPWKMLQEIGEMIESSPQGVEIYFPHHRFVMLDAVRLASGKGRVPGNLVSALFCLEACRSPSRMLEELEHLGRLLEEPGREELRRSFADWLYQAYLPSRLGKRFPEFQELDVEEVRKMIELREDAWCLQWKKEGFKEGFDKGQREGLHVGRRKGRQEGQRSLLRRQLKHKFGKVSRVDRRKIAAASASKLLTWSERLLNAQSLEQVFED